MTQSTVLPCSTQTPLPSAAFCVSPSQSFAFVCRVSPPVIAHSLIGRAVCVRHCSHSLEARLRWKQSFRASSDFWVELQGHESQRDSFDFSAFGVRNRDCQKLKLRCRAMADPSAKEAGGLPAQEFTFTNKNGQRLKGLLVDGGAGSKEVCILCHGFRSSKQSGTLSAISAGLAEAGVSTFRFDFSGNGESEGKFAYGNYWQEVEDLRAAFEFWTSKGSRVVCVAGHSKGGNCVVLYASKYHDVPCVINISGRFALEKGQCPVHWQLPRLSNMRISTVAGATCSVRAAIARSFEKWSSSLHLRNVVACLMLFLIERRTRDACWWYIPL